ncbi:MAG: hypothetical protein C0459_06920 [Chitinophaga sp.]|jgi:methionyl-tRNA formyltransferase|nr:hypothetical protein [Chitinophaga sp.]
MKVVILCSSDVLALPGIAQLQQQKQLQAVCVTVKTKSILIPVFLQLGIDSENIYVLEKVNLENQLVSILNKYQPDALLTLTFSYQIPVKVLEMLPGRCINFHFGLLPKYRGSDPIFWQIKNREQKGGIAVHTMNEQIDCGDILHIATLPILKEDTYGMHGVKLGMLAAQLMANLNTIVTAQPLSQQLITDTDYFKPPGQQMLTIDWHNQTAESIIALVNAANPKYDGAITIIKQQPVKILELSIVNVNTEQVFLPGTIVHADYNYGLIVACINKLFVQINLVHVNEGYLSGIKLFSLGLQIGDQFI